MIFTTSIDNQLPPWTVSAGKILIVLMVAGLALTIGRDIYNMHTEWTAYTCRDTCARGSNVPTPKEITPMPNTIRIRLVKHAGVDMEEITLERDDGHDRTAGNRLEDDDPGRKHNGH